MNLDVMKHLDLFNGLGYPMLLGTSRKSMIGLTLDLPVSEREEGTLVTTVMAVQSIMDLCAFMMLRKTAERSR